MGIIKSLIYMFLFLLILRVFGYIFQFIYFFGMNRFKKTTNESSDQQHALKMLQCEKCKTYIVKSEAYIYNGKIYCKRDHAS